MQHASLQAVLSAVLPCCCPQRHGMAACEELLMSLPAGTLQLSLSKLLQAANNFPSTSSNWVQLGLQRAIDCCPSQPISQHSLP